MKNEQKKLHQITEWNTIQTTGLGMGTVIMQKAYGVNAGKALQAAQREITMLEGMMSRFKPDSEIGRINSSAGIKCEHASAETYEVLDRALEFSRISEGRFDITVCPLVDLWSRAISMQSAPDISDIGRILPLVDYRLIVLNPRSRTCALVNMEQSIDLGGIAKGFAADKAVEIYRQYGVEAAYINIGGNVAVVGKNHDDRPWRIGIQHPRQDNCLIGVVSIIDKTVVTSGDYQRYFVDSIGIRRHHILDPSTGYPAQSGLASVTIVGSSSMEADALSTILFITGMERGAGILKAFPGTDAIFVDTGMQVHITKGLKDGFHAMEGTKLNVLNC